MRRREGEEEESKLSPEANLMIDRQRGRQLRSLRVSDPSFLEQANKLVIRREDGRNELTQETIPQDEDLVNL
jgi:hypothetical protein